VFKHTLHHAHTHTHTHTHDYSIIIIYQQWTMRIYTRPAILLYASNSVNENFFFHRIAKQLYYIGRGDLSRVLYWGIFEWPINPPGTRTRTRTRVGEVWRLCRVLVWFSVVRGGDDVEGASRIPTTTMVYYILYIIIIIVYIHRVWRIGFVIKKDRINGTPGGCSYFFPNPSL